MLVAPPIEKYLNNEKNLKQIVDDLANELEDAEKIGSNIHIDDSAKFDCKIIPYGNIEQDTREGYNKLPILFSSTAKNGITLTVKDNGTILLNGTATTYAVFDATFLSEINLEGYVWKLKQNSGTITSGNIQFFLYNSDYSVNQNIALTTEVSNVQITLNANSYAIERITIPTGTVLNNVELYSMISETEKEYEQYGAMPSLGFSSPVKHVGGSVKSYNLAYVEAEGQFREYTTGTFKGTANYNSYIANVNENKTYSSQYTGEATGISNLCFFDKDMNYLSGLAYSSEDKSFTTPENCAYVTMAVHINITDYMLVEGTSSKPYLPYGDIGSVYDIAKVNKDVLGWGIQLIDNIGWNASGVKYTTDNTFGTNDLIKVTHDVLTIYDKNYVATSVYGRFNTYDINKNLVSSELIQKMPFTRTFADNEKYYTFHILKEFISYGESLQTEIGDTATDYTAHQEENRSLDLTNLPLYSKNDYIYKSGDKWFVHNEWSKYEITGNEAHIGVSELGNGLYQFFIGPINNLLQSSTEIVAYSNYLKGVKFEDRRNYDDCIYGYANDNYIRITTSKYSTVDELKAKLQELYNAGTPVYIIYKLATSTETEITDESVIEVLEVLYNSKTFKGVTNISTEKNLQDAADLILKIEYKKSNQVKIKELEKEIENLKALILEA